MSISGRDDGTIDAIYIRLSNDKIARTKEIDRDALLADYNAKGKIVGIEILAPVKIEEVVKLVDPAKRPHLRNFVGQTSRHMVVA
ncbi:MAG: DUF2283 domain-containing protein [Planctomycetes bacterium]|nr:DUF2283 domain-containing protein [Planctomycetota bacterium]